MYEVLGIERDVADGKPRTRLICREPEPAILRMNLSKLDSVRLSQFEDLIGQTAMLPCRSSQMENGMRFLVLEDGQPIPVPSLKPTEVSKSVETPKAPAGVIPPLSSMK